MRVDSYLELFTTLYGWAFANIIGGLLTGVGLIYVPFMAIGFQIWREAKESASAGGSAIGLSEAVQVKLILSLFVFVMCFATIPGLTLDGKLRYLPLGTDTNPNPVEVSTGNTGTTYDNAMQDATNGTMVPGGSAGSLTGVPLWWYFVMAVSSGVNDAVRGAIGNSQNQLRDIEALARNAGIQDPKLNAEIAQFTSECFVTARSRYLNAAQWNSKDNQNQPVKIDPEYLNILSRDNKDYGPSDIDWIGSHFFRTTPGFYDTLRSKNPVDGFALDLSATGSVEGAELNRDPTTSASIPAFRKPTCNEWWVGDGSNAGLRARILSDSYTETVLNSKLCSLTNLRTPDADACKDLVAKAAATYTPPPPVDTAGSQGNDAGWATNLGRIGGGALAMPTIISRAVEWLMAFFHMASALQMLQSVILMGIYFMLPMIVVMSGYKLEMMWYGAVAIFTVKFWTVFWFIAQWFDAHLWSAMYISEDGIMVWGDLKQMVAGNGPMTPKRLVLDLVLMGMYLGFPAIWSGMMAWIGVHVGQALGNVLSDNARPGENKTGMKAPSPTKIAGEAAKIAVKAITKI